jgi:hypothetical protein
MAWGQGPQPGCEYLLAVAECSVWPGNVHFHKRALSDLAWDLDKLCAGEQGSGMPWNSSLNLPVAAHFYFAKTGIVPFRHCQVLEVAHKDPPFHAGLRGWVFVFMQEAWQGHKPFLVLVSRGTSSPEGGKRVGRPLGSESVLQHYFLESLRGSGPVVAWL